MSENTNTEREAFIRDYIQVMYSDEMAAAYAWDNDHLDAMLWRASPRIPVAAFPVY